MQGQLVESQNVRKEGKYTFTLRDGEEYYGRLLHIDSSRPAFSNWLRYINSCRWAEEQNILIYMKRFTIYFVVIKEIPPREELLVWYGANYMGKLGYYVDRYKYQYGISPPKAEVRCPDCHDMDRHNYLRDELFFALRVSCADYELRQQEHDFYSFKASAKQLITHWMVTKNESANIRMPIPSNNATFIPYCLALCQDLRGTNDEEDCRSVWPYIHIADEPKFAKCPFAVRRAGHRHVFYGHHALHARVNEDTEYYSRELYVDGKRKEYGNWLRWVNSCRWGEEQNLMAVYKGLAVYYVVIKEIPPGTELLVYYGSEYSQRLGYYIDEEVDKKSFQYGICPPKDMILCSHVPVEQTELILTNEHISNVQARGLVGKCDNSDEDGIVETEHDEEL